MPEINLLSKEFRNQTDVALRKRSVTIWLYCLIGLAVVEVMVYGGMFFYLRNLQARFLKAENEIAAVEFEIGKVESQRLNVVSFQERLKNLDILLKDHLMWSEVFQKLEEATYNQAVYKDLEVDEESHTFILTGAVPTFTDLAKLILGLQQFDYILDVKLNTSSQEEVQAGSLAGFSLEIVFDPNILYR